MSAAGYEYIERIKAPSVVEFYTLTNQGHRVVRIYLDSHNPRFEAFNETDCTRTPAILYWQEVNALIQRARQIVGLTQTLDPKDQPNEDR
jgi:hypothetical protein